jgi:hypothetical protein
MAGVPHLSQDTILPMEHRRFLTTTILATAIIFLFTAPELRAQAYTKGRPVGASAAELKPGDYVWHPEVSPAGPVVVVVSLPDQILYVYRNGVEIGRAPVGGIEAARLSGTYVYSALTTVDSAGRRDWINTATVGKKPPNLKDLATASR